ncbi:MAG: response regulator [Oscillospiraceae bacterium]|nr:response regulator [Oscillospiraceae bacterium]
MKKKTVLIVDDSAFMRRLLREAVTSIGFVVVGEARNGKIALAKYKELKPNIVTMDVVMEEMNGIEALSRIMGHDPKAKVVMVSSMGQELVVKDAIILGAKGFILKPFNTQQIANALKKL